jgi:hypothetical protein
MEWKEEEVSQTKKNLWKKKKGCAYKERNETKKKEVGECQMRMLFRGKE